MNANGKFKIKGKKIPNYDSEIEVDIGSGNAEKYEVISKKVPDPTSYDGGTITWFNAYGVKDKKTGDFAKIHYTVVLSALPAGKKKLFALVNDVPQELEFQTTGSGKIKFTWDLGDPPIGIWP
ncbi:MAG: hypothetical protein ACOYZ6_04250 [Chloroflexota bacterium]